MNLQKLNPWNWFKHEDGQRVEVQQVPVTRDEAEKQPAGDLATPSPGADSLLRLHQEMDQLFDNVFNAFGMPSMRSTWPQRWSSGSSTSGWNAMSYRPQVDVSGDDKQYEITLDVPGLTAENLAIELEGDVLKIKGTKEEKTENKDKQFYRVERSYGTFQRTLALPDDAVAEDIHADLKDGVLHLTIPRHERPPKDVRQIQINS